MKPRIFVTASDSRQAEYWMRQLNIGKTEWQYLSRPEMLQGMDGVLIIKCGDRYMGRDALEMYEVIQYLENLKRCTVMRIPEFNYPSR